MLQAGRYAKDYMNTQIFILIPIIQLEIHYREISGNLDEKKFSGFIDVMVKYL